MTGHRSPPYFPPSAADAAGMAQAAWDDAARWMARGVDRVRESFDAPVGLTPKDAVWSLNKATLYRYRPTKPASERWKVPLLLVYALINKPYIFDLRPGQSFVEYLRDEGFDVYLLDWGEPGPEDADTTFMDHSAEYLPRAVRRVLRLSGARELSLLGYCMGATMAVAYAALFPEAPIRNLITLTLPLDYSHTQGDIFAAWFDPRYFDLDAFLEHLGNVPHGFILQGAKLLKPMENFITTYQILERKLEDEDAVKSWQVIHRWTHDGQDVPREVFREWVRDIVRGNKLVKGEMKARGRRANLANIRAPLLNVIADKDHIIPPENSKSLMHLVSSEDKHLEVISGGHVGIMAGRAARYKLWPKIAAWLGQRSQH